MLGCWFLVCFIVKTPSLCLNDFCFPLIRWSSHCDLKNVFGKSSCPNKENERLSLAFEWLRSTICQGKSKNVHIFFLFCVFIAVWIHSINPQLQYRVAGTSLQYFTQTLESTTAGVVSPLPPDSCSVFWFWSCINKQPLSFCRGLV